MGIAPLSSGMNQFTAVAGQATVAAPVTAVAEVQE